jgi:serine protease Do
MGIGFAIPSNMAKQIMDQIIEKGGVTRGFLGVSLQPVDKDIADAFNLPKPEGALISEVVKDSPADKAGIKQGDIILEYNKTSIKSLQNFRKDISMMAPGSTVKLKINRKGEVLNISLSLGSASDNETSEGVVQKIGMEIDNLTADLAKQLGYSSKEEGVVIIKVKPGSPAALVGLRPGFLIQAVNHRKVSSVSDLNDVISQVENKRVLLLVRQGNMTRFYSVKVE